MKKKLILFLLVLSALFIYQSCKKIDTPAGEHISLNQTSAKFFAIPANADPLVLRVAAQLQQQNEEKEFITALVKNMGYPVWSKAQVRKSKPVVNRQNNTSNFTEEEETIVIIPLALENTKFVSGCLQAIIGDSITITTHSRSGYALYPFGGLQSSGFTAEKYQIEMMRMDRDVFGDSVFFVLDKRLFYNPGQMPDSSNEYTLITLKHVIATPSQTQDCDIVCMSIFDRTGGIDTGSNAIAHVPRHTECNVICTGTGGGGGTGITPGGGNTPAGGGGGGTVPVTPPLSPVLQYLQLTLGYDGLETPWLQAHLVQANAMYAYLHRNTQRLIVAKARMLNHLERMMTDNAYLNFVLMHDNTGNADLIWWEDDTWLDTIPTSTTIPVFHIDADSGEPGIDLQKYMNCFSQIPNAGATYTIKLCSDIPVDGHPTWKFNTDGSPGHTFLTLTKTNGNQTITQSVGFYPTDGNDSPGKFVDNGSIGFQHEYNAALTFNNVASGAFNAVIQHLLNHQNDRYKLATNNCTNLAVDAINTILQPPLFIDPLDIPSPLPGGTITIDKSPQTRYSAIQNFNPSVLITKEVKVVSYAPLSHGPCN